MIVILRCVPPRAQRGIKIKIKNPNKLSDFVLLPAPGAARDPNQTQKYVKIHPNSVILRCVPPRAQRGIKIKMILILRCSRPWAQRGIKIKMILILRCSRPRAQRGIKIKKSG